MYVQTVKSPGGIDAWLVEEFSVPMMAMCFGFAGGGSSQDPVGKAGLSKFISFMNSEGAGDLKASEFRDQIADIAARLEFSGGKDLLTGSFETLTEHRDEATQLLKLALTKPRFDPDAVERVRRYLLSSVASAECNPAAMAHLRWDAAAFGNHAYGRSMHGSAATIAEVTREDLEAHHKRVLAKETLRVVAVGDITADELGELLDEAFGDLPDKADLIPVPQTIPVRPSLPAVLDLDVTQSAVVFGFGAMPHHDADCTPARVLTHIIGGGSTSKLFEEVRLKRGLAYSVWTDLKPWRYASVLRGGVATRWDMVSQSLDIICEQLQNMANGDLEPTQLENAKSYLIRSYALNFDANQKIAAHLLGLCMAGFGPDHIIEGRKAQIEAVTLGDLDRVAKRLLNLDNLIVSVVGKEATKHFAAAG